MQVGKDLLSISPEECAQGLKRCCNICVDKEGMKKSRSRGVKIGNICMCTNAIYYIDFAV